MPSTVSLTKPMEKWVAEQAAANGLKNTDAYLQQLVREEQKRQAVQLLIEKLDEAKASGYHEVTNEMWKERKKRVIASFRAKKKNTRTKK